METDPAVRAKLTALQEATQELMVAKSDYSLIRTEWNERIKLLTTAVETISDEIEDGCRQPKLFELEREHE